MTKEIISFDLWGTLIKSSPSYTDLKYNSIKEKYSIPYSITELKEKFVAYKKRIDCYVESYGIHPEQQLLFAGLMYDLGIKGNVNEFIKFYNNMFENYGELIYLADVVDVLNDLSKTYDLIVVSNTVLTYGEQLVPKLGLIEKFIKEFRFSDVYKISKPNNLWGCKPILHVGDNKNTDGASVNYGIPFLYVQNDIIKIYENL